jgi:hypothetical protein
VPRPEKPRQRSGYRREETLQVESACLTVAVTLGALMDNLCLVGGLVPSLIIGRELGAGEDPGESRPGTNDLDVGIAVALLDDHQYAEISRRLLQEGFEPDTNEKGNPTLQRRRWGDPRMRSPRVWHATPSTTVTLSRRRSSFSYAISARRTLSVRYRGRVRECYGRGEGRGGPPTRRDTSTTY